MPPAAISDNDTREPSYTKSAGAKPLPGYVLLEPLGRGGFGEVWKCEAPGGLHKAVKFVAGDPDSDDGGGDQLRQEFDAFQQIKAIRHPFLLTLERVELIGGELIMVMELADRQLQDRFRECQRQGLSGIPRAELLSYLAEAAEALDVIGAQYGLQHLDVKPANLFLTAGHVKVGDYGLVSRLEKAKPDDGGSRGLTPRYVAPEVLRGEVGTRSDQYSLALVYFELVTGGFPYTGKTAAQLMMQHMMAPPDLTALPDCDKPAVARALSKNPDDRYPSCLDFVGALVASTPAEPGRAARPRPTRPQPPADPASLSDRHPRPDDASVTTSRGRPPSNETTEHVTISISPPHTVAGGKGLPPLITAATKQQISTSVPTPPPRIPAPAPPPGPRNDLITTPPPRNDLIVTPPPRASGPIRMPGTRLSESDLPLAESTGEPAVRLNSIRSVVPVARLLGGTAADPAIQPVDFANAVVAATAPGGHAPQTTTDIGRTADGAWVCRFPTTVAAQMVPFKLTVIPGLWGVTVEQPDPLRLVFKKHGSKGLLGAFGKKPGLEVVVQLAPPGRSIGEVVVTGGLFGNPDQAFARAAENSIPQLIGDIRRELQNVEDRRKHPRLPASFPVSIYPIHSDGGIDPPLRGICKDVSVGGLSFVVPTPLRTKYSYVAFEGIKAVAGVAILMRLVRSQKGDEVLAAGSYRTDL